MPYNRHYFHNIRMRYQTLGEAEVAALHDARSLQHTPGSFKRSREDDAFGDRIPLHVASCTQCDAPVRILPDVRRFVIDYDSPALQAHCPASTGPTTESVFSSS